MSSTLFGSSCSITRIYQNNQLENRDETQLMSRRVTKASYHTQSSGPKVQINLLFIKERYPIGHFYARPRETENVTISEGCMGLTIIKSDNQPSLPAVGSDDLTAACLYTHIFALLTLLCRDC